MKKNNISPILELSFAAGVMIILALPFAVNAQDHKEFMVNINNSDTTINGKNIKDLSTADRKDALKKLSELNDHISITKKEGGDEIIVVDKKTGKNNVSVYRSRSGNNSTAMANAYSITIDSTDRPMVIADNMIREGGDMLPRITRDYKLGQVMSGSGRGFSTLMMSGNRRNSQNFSYSNTDSEGINTHISFNVSDASAEKTKKITGTEKTDLNLQDLNITQSFSTGKTTLSFTLASKAAADVQFKDSEGTVLWEGKTTGADFSKSFTLPKNGAYYLQVKQAGKLALRKITKEE